MPKCSGSLSKYHFSCDQQRYAEKGWALMLALALCKPDTSVRPSCGISFYLEIEDQNGYLKTGAYN